jgi:hypothetical protein
LKVRRRRHMVEGEGVVDCEALKQSSAREDGGEPRRALAAHGVAA